jgi:sugar phosphate isomerase/epimerase
MPDSTRLTFGVVASALDNDPRRAAQLSRTLGFSGLLFDAFSSSLILPDLSLTGRREFLHVLESQNQRLVGVQCDLGNKGFAPGADVDRAIARLDRAMDAAAGLQSPLVCCDLGPLPPVRSATKSNPRVTKEQAGLILLPETFDAAPAPESTSLESIPPNVDPTFESQVVGALAELGRHADRYGVTVAFRSELASFASLDSVIRKSSCPWFGVELDPVAMLRDDWSIDEIFSTLGPLVRHVRARDAVKGADRRTKPAIVGKGNVNWQELTSNLEGGGYHGWITIDPVELTDRSGAASAARQYLTSLG